jgi:ribosome-binding factor A
MSDAKSKKVGRLNEDIKKELILILQGMKDPRLEKFWTIMRVETSPDLSDAKVYVSVMGSDEDAEEVLKAMNGANGYIRGELSKRLHIRRSPVFKFIRDENLDYAMHIDDILHKIKDSENEK